MAGSGYKERLMEHRENLVNSKKRAGGDFGWGLRGGTGGG